jgi:hypothetical protein
VYPTSEFNAAYTLSALGVVEVMMWRFP